MVKEIQLTKGLVTLVDDEDFERLNKYNWSILKKREKLYAHRKENKKTITLHRFILNAEKEILVDHINGNCLDNRRCNLRLCDNKQNIRNSKKRSNLSSKYKGVSWQKDRIKWSAQISVNSKRISLGRCSDEIEAAKKYDKAARFYFGEFASLNFPDIREVGCLDLVCNTTIEQNLTSSKRRKSKNSTSEYEGISYAKQKKKWQAYFLNKITKKQTHIGYFKTEEEALEARNEYLKTI
jgi:hypothetical protein